ncbi:MULTISPECIES: type II toxin-antitoxin system Phd/YefM family antitoxin [unclassified Corynebacterium]|uniref:type II toxin-antitoxin system Phd/YefM family antitoxin n=1 Tax=unclassified Corynebacterium TaxID=2624378 RepID=UPI0029CA9435|nr:MULTISPECIES: type II toxin-antitoxin system Phd/YefM family antitoxin [unclassified Corynebacterium]WPF65816.1 type II toxin-antitoxin system Phd/YefM family antitoxin [Corynebacterium sp. 22KM0430]WPF68309.1 type II toxin-antitoxin system Phd/YefM family antitoxin [Corynebacterium sp. 21KM1197]
MSTAITPTEHMSLPLAELRASIGEIVNRVRLTGQRVEITRNGTPAAIIVPLEDIKTLERLEEQADLIALEHARLTNNDEGNITLEEHLAEVEAGRQDD